MKARKAQLLGQIMMMILAAIIIIMILYFGYKAIVTLGSKACNVEIVRFQKDLSDSVDKIGIDYKSQVKKQLSLPCSYVEVCFINLEKARQYPTPASYETATGKSLSDLNPIIQNAVFDPQGQETNVYLVDPKKGDIQQAYIGNFTIDYPATNDVYYCARAAEGPVIIKLEGLGDRARISPWE